MKYVRAGTVLTAETQLGEDDNVLEELVRQLSEKFPIPQGSVTWRKYRMLFKRVTIRFVTVADAKAAEQWIDDDF